MIINVPISDDNYRKFQAALILTNESEDAALTSLIENYIAAAFSKVVPAREQTVMDSGKTPNKAITRIPLWARRTEQFNSRILQSFFLCEQQGVAAKSAMKAYFQEASKGTEWQFENNFASMCTNEGQSHGKVFEYIGDTVRLCPEIETIARQHQREFECAAPSKSIALTHAVTASTPTIIQRQAFISWFKQQLYHGQPYNPVTISGYSSRIESACASPAFDTIEPKNLFSITDPYEFKTIKDAIMQCPGFAAFDAKSHNGFTAALNKYEQYLAECSQGGL